MQIIAAGIRNLTDARYFSAMGANVIIYDLRPESELSHDRAKEIIDWVEGPGVCLDLRGHDAIGVVEAIEALAPDGVVFDLFMSRPEGYSGRIIRVINRETSELVSDGRKETLLIERPWSCDNPADLDRQLVDKARGNDIWIDFRVVLGFLEKMGECRVCGGIVVYGGDEEAIGMKAYDDLDEVFSLLGIN